MSNYGDSYYRGYYFENIIYSYFYKNIEIKKNDIFEGIYCRKCHSVVNVLFIPINERLRGQCKCCNNIFL